MNPGRATRAVARIATGLSALVLLAAGAYAITEWAGLDLQRRWSLYPDRLAVYSAPHQSWWPWALTAAAVVLLLLGIAALVACLRPHRAPRSTLARTDLGWLAVDPSTACDAVAAGLAAQPGILAARARARLVDGRSTLTVTLTAEPDTDIDRLHAAIAGTAAEIRSALGDSAPHVRFLVDMDRPRRDTGRPA